MASGRHVNRKVILLVGPTGVGKTAVSILLAKRLGAEIISADSMQIYRHMDIGTEKPTAHEQSEVRHHMLDVVEPWERYSVGRYVEAVKPIIEGLLAEGKTPLVVGGTGLYIKAMTRGLFSGPSADKGLREQLKKEDSGSLYKRLCLLDPYAAGGIAPSDKRRLVRALEVCHKTGEKMSALRTALTVPLPYEFVKIGLMRDRKELYGMLEERTEGMLRRGLIGEVRGLLEMNPSETPMQAIGYKEVADYLKGLRPLDEAVRLIKRNTKRYAKRQVTWFKKEDGIRWIDVTGIFEPAQMFEKMLDRMFEMLRPLVLDDD